MPWFECSVCCDTVKKPKITAHARRCRGAYFTCIDCSLTFSLQSVQGHTACVTEDQKYIDGATKPGGFAVNGFVGQAAPKSTSDVLGSEYLSSGPHWRCSICKVDCTSEATLLSHASGQKHQRRCRAAAAAAAQQAAPTKVAPDGNTNRSAKSDTQKVSEGACEGTGPENSTKVKRESTPTEEDATKSKKQKKSKADNSIDMPQIVVHALSKKGGTAKLQKLLSIVTKKLAKHDGAEAADKDAALAKVLAADGTGFEIVVRIKEEE